MPKIKVPLLSFEAHGTLAKATSFLKRRGRNIAEKKPIPTDAKSPLQLEWRHMYQKAVALWHALSPEEKREWESLARSRHMPGFAWFLSQCLKPNPGIYLPLQGGTMQGDIDMAKHRIIRLPEPEDDQEPARKVDLEAFEIIQTFLGLTDTPSSYSGQAGKYPRVNALENALEFIALTLTFLGLTDTPASYSGQAGKFPRVNTLENALEFAPAAADYPFKLKPAITRYVLPGWYIGEKGTHIPVVGMIYYIPIFVTETTTYTRICMDVKNEAAGTADLRIFNWNNGLPGSLVLSAGTVNTGTIGAKEIIIAQQLTRGYYFVAYRCTAAPTLHCAETSYALTVPIPGLVDSSAIRISKIVLTVSAAYADPAPAPTGALDAWASAIYLKET